MLPEAAAVMTEAGAPRWSLVFLMRLTDGAYVRAWAGVGDLEIAADDIDLEGGVFVGIGFIGDIPALRMLVNGAAERVEFSLNGVDEWVMELANEDAELVRGAEVNVGLILFDDEWQLVSEPAWLWDGTADVIIQDVDGQGETLTRSVRLSVGSAFTEQTRVGLGAYTDADQQQRHPGDTFCARVAGYAIDSTIVWPAPG